MRVGLPQVGEHIWLVTFMQYELGYFDTRHAGSNRSTPVWPESVTHVSGMTCDPCDRNGPV
jgi:hypothetical protein